MKLFQRTLWSFVGVISLQAVLIGAALSSIFGSMQGEDASRELSAEAANAYESFNAWKLAFWKDINEIAEDPALRRAVGRAAGSTVRDRVALGELARHLATSAASAAAIRDDSTGECRYIEIGPDDAVLPEASSFSVKKEHPYVEILSSMGGLWFLATVRVERPSSSEGKSLDVFLLRRIDGELLGKLSYDPMVALAVAVPRVGSVISGMYSGTPVSARVERREMAFVEGIADGASGGRAYLTYPEMNWRGGSYSAVVQQTGSVDLPGGERPVILAAALSLAGYAARAARLQRSVLSVTLAVVAFTIVIALLLSRSIVSPIRRLSTAMRRIEGGDYRAEVRGPGSGELGELLFGFNGMARKLAADKLELERYIAEIVGLKERGDGIIESIREGLAVIDPDGRVESANSSFRCLFGPAAAVPGASIADIDRGPFDDSVVEAAREALRDNASRGDIVRRAPDGRSFEIKLYPLVAAPRPEAARCIVVVEDVSDRLAYEERAIHAEKLASMGMLSAGIAHEINNPLSSILANVGNAISESRDPEAVASLRVVESETLRIARIVRQLLDFSAPGPSSASSDRDSLRCDANAVARELVRLVGYPFKGGGRIEFLELLEPDCPEAAIAEDELKQVLLNLLKNALFAVGEAGCIWVETRSAAGRVEVAVADDGPGIPDSMLGRIFDPFFTTKAGDGGAGLGLSVAYGIVAQRGGSIRAANEANGGALFVVDLPAAGDGRKR
jgi:signal transduction histidine kinase